MKITFVGRHMSVPEDMKVLLEKKLAKFDRYFSDEPDATVTFSRKRNRENIEVTISAGGTLFRCETDDETFRNAIDHAVDTIDRQIRRNKTRLAKRLRPDAFAASAGALQAEDTFDEPEATEFVIRRTPVWSTRVATATTVLSHRRNNLSSPTVGPAASPVPQKILS